MDLRPRMYAISQGPEGGHRSRSAGRVHPHLARRRRDRRRRRLALSLRHAGATGARRELRRRLPANDRQDRRPRGRSTTWPYEKGSKVKLFVLAGHRNMEGERAFVQELEALDAALAQGQRRDRLQVQHRRRLQDVRRLGTAWARRATTTPSGPSSASRRLSKRMARATSPSPSSRTAVRRSSTGRRRAAWPSRATSIRIHRVHP